MTTSTIRCMWDDKVCYTRAEADATLTKARTTYVKTTNIPQRAYFCSKCGFWHLTHLKYEHTLFTAREKTLIQRRKQDKHRRKNLALTDYEDVMSM